MNRWKSFMALLLMIVMITTNSTIFYVDADNQNNGENSITVSGEGSGDASGEGQKEYVTISFYDDGKLVKTVQIEKGSTIEWWEPIPRSEYYVFKGWCYLVEENKGVLVKKEKVYNNDMSLHAYWEYVRKSPIVFPSLEERQRQQEIIRQSKKISFQTYHAEIAFKNISVQKNKRIHLKIRSTRMPQSPIELQYSTSKKFTKGKTKTKVIKRSKNTSVKKFKKVTIKNLKKNKTYYIRARVKTQYNGQTFYSKWSKVQKVKMKKKQIKKK